MTFDPGGRKAKTESLTHTFAHTRKRHKRAAQFFVQNCSQIKLNDTILMFSQILRISQIQTLSVRVLCFLLYVVLVSKWINKLFCQCYFSPLSPFILKPPLLGTRCCDRRDPAAVHQLTATSRASGQSASGCICSHHRNGNSIFTAVVFNRRGVMGKSIWCVSTGVVGSQ